MDNPFRGGVRIRAPQDFPVDLLVGRFVWQQGVLERAVRKPLGGLELPVVHPEDWILLKLDAGGPGDLWDLHQILRLAPDREALSARVEVHLGALDRAARKLWQRVRSEIKD